MRNQHLVSIITIAYNRPRILQEFLDAVYTSSYKEFEIIVMNNSRKELRNEYETLLKTYMRVKHIWNEKNLLIAGAWNAGLKEAKGDLILFCGDDYIFDKDMLDYLMESIDQSADVGIAGPMLYYTNGDMLIPTASLSLSTGIPMLKKCLAGDNAVRIIDGVIMMKCEVLRKIGGFDEKNFPFYMESADFCMRAFNAGYKSVLRFEAKATHKHLPLKAYIIPNPERYVNPATYYYLMTTKIKYIRKYANILQKMIFFPVFLPLLFIWHMSVIIIRGRKDVWIKSSNLGRGVINGLFSKL
ncbi:MAG: glycosyltransferase [Candidatus Omnitrophota bacterium]